MSLGSDLPSDKKSKVKTNSYSAFATLFFGTTDILLQYLLQSNADYSHTMNLCRVQKIQIPRK